MMSWLTKFFFLVVVISALSVGAAFGVTQIVKPQVNHQVEPLGVNEIQFSWILSDSQNGTFQKAYCVTVFSDKATNAKVWDSGWIESSQTVEVSYSGAALEPSQRYFWTVAVRNNRDEVAALPMPASFVTGWEKDRNAQWISMSRTDADPLPIFRKSFSVNGQKKISGAVLHICGLGHYELRLNGKNVGVDPAGERFIDPGWTNYRKTCLYSTFDVTDSMTSGENVIGVMLGNGMYNVPGGRYVKFTGSFGLPKLIAELRIRYDDGEAVSISTDETWQAALGPITFSCVYGGEDEDRRREQVAWVPATVVDSPGGTLCSQEAPPVVVAKTMTPESLRRLDDGRYVADFGYNFSGRPRVLVQGKAGQTVTVTTAEIVDRVWSGHSYTLTLRGDGDELLLPKFSYFGFQFLYIEGAVTDADRTGNDSEKPTLLSACADFTTSAAEPCGSFACSDDLINEIDAMIDRSVRSNLQSVVTDCPHREKLGWLEVPHLMGPSILYRYNVQNLYRKICSDMCESQLDNGLVPDISPEFTRFADGFFESPEWGSAVVQIPALLESFYGDTSATNATYAAMEKYIEYLDSTRHERADRLVKPGLGDWYDWSAERSHAGYSQHTPRELTATAIFIDDLKKMVRFASERGQTQDAKKFSDTLADAKKAYEAAYCLPNAPSVATGSQASLAESYFVVDEDRKESVLNQLVARIEADEFKPTVGEVTFVRLILALVDGNRDDVLWKMIARTDKPGYGYMLRECGMKTLSETWDGPGSSMNHCMFGHIQEWFTSRIAGIGVPAGGRVVLAPTPVGHLTWARGVYDSAFGRIESDWKIEGNRFIYHCVIPTNLHGTVRIPTSDIESVHVNGEKVTVRRDAYGNSIVELENGTYHIEANL